MPRKPEIEERLESILKSARAQYDSRVRDLLEAEERKARRSGKPAPKSLPEHVVNRELAEHAAKTVVGIASAQINFDPALRRNLKLQLNRYLHKQLASEKSLVASQLASELAQHFPKRDKQMAKRLAVELASTADFLHYHLRHRPAIDVSRALASAMRQFEEKKKQILGELQQRALKARRKLPARIPDAVLDEVRAYYAASEGVKTLVEHAKPEEINAITNFVYVHLREKPVSEQTLERLLFKTWVGEGSRRRTLYDVMRRRLFINPADLVAHAEFVQTALLHTLLHKVKR